MVGAQFWQIYDLGVVYDYADLVDCDIFSFHELYGMLKELGLRDNNNKILFMHFRIHGVSLDDGLVRLMANVDLLVSQSYSKGADNGVVIEEIVEDNVVSISRKDSRLLMLECIGKGFDVCPVVEPRNDENVGNLDYYKEVPMANPFSFGNLTEDSNVEIHNVENVWNTLETSRDVGVISKKARILELKRRHLKIIVLTSNTSYPSRKIGCICACTSQKTRKETRSIRRLRKKYCLSLKNDMPPRDRIHEVSLDEGLVRLMADVDVIKLLNHVPRLLMLEWPEIGKKEEHVDTLNHASAFDVCPVVEPSNDENVGNLDC
ncbi:hypothetical protein Tco_0820751 [Tanacetum coccineum]|uniref:Uncharacterized protein n=1 Tax=Tanacetum coccineum TaxID=301880 RepID=A0ABQ5ACY5_9ASTR